MASLRPIISSVQSDPGEVSLKDAMIKMSQTNRFEYKRLKVVHEVMTDGKQTLEVTINTQAYSKAMDEEEMRVLYNVMREIFEGKDE